MDGHHNHNDMDHSHQMDPKMESMHNEHNDMSAAEMDHSMKMDHMMKMYFHGGYDEVILFKFWQISTIGGLIGSMFACFALAIIYEAIKFYRESVFRKHFRKSPSSDRRSGNRYNSVSPEQSSLEGGGAGDSIEVNREELERDHTDDTVSIRTVETKMWSKGHIFLTLLQMVQVTLAYMLMLIFMTYNSWLCLATVLGATVGYFLFGWRRTVMLEDNDHCH